MDQKERLREICATYQKHGWQLRRILIRPETRADFGKEQEFAGVGIEAANIDALWFSRPSYEKREAWELRLLAETPYALFETLEADKCEADRLDALRGMEERMREYLKK
jgi:hypothetical protein